MIDDLDKLEAIAKAAQEDVGGDWVVDRMTTEECEADGVPARDGHGYWIMCGHDDSVLGDGAMLHSSAEHIAAFSPDVVLRLIARVRVAEEATKYLYDNWEDAEGQAGLYVFGPGERDEEYLESQGVTVHKASDDVQALVRRLVKP